MKYLKYLFVSILGTIIIFLLINFNTTTREYYIKNNTIINEFNNLKSNILQLKYNVLTNSVYMYENNDKINESIKVLEKSINNLINNKFLQQNFFDEYVKIKILQKIINKKINNVYEYQIANSAIKNSTMYLANLLKKYQTLNIDHSKYKDYQIKLIEVVSDVFLAKSSFDKDYINKNVIKFFENFSNDEKIKSFNDVFVANLKVFSEYFPVYDKQIKNILNNNDIKLLNKIYNSYFVKMNQKLKIVKIVSWVLIIFVLATGMLIMFLLYKEEKEKIELQKLNKEIKQILIIDKLTGLFNRTKFDEDITKFKHPVLILINIDKFKHINDYYGMAFGDKVLIKVAEILKNLVGSGKKIYRIGADDFALLYEYEKDKKYEDIAKKIINYFDNHNLQIENIKLILSVSIGISFKPPYLENADIALKNVKKDIRKKCLIYNDSMNEKEKIGINIIKTKTLYEAIKNDRIIPYFQPIVDVKTGKIVKYEVLARVITNNGIQSIFPYLQIAKETKLYSDITKTIFLKAFEKLKNKNVEFSLNVSIDDIIDENMAGFFEELYENNRETVKNMTLELLESEAIGDYNIIEKFINASKQKEAKIAIDDFGSGYSNFSRILNLHIDYIKIDGSLIKNITNDVKSYKIVKFLASFAKENNIKTIAEFVENKEILEIIKDIGIDYAQGYYFYKPDPEIL